MKIMSSRIFKIIYIGSFLWIISICLTYAQTDNIAFRNLSSAEGLPVTSVTDVTQDAYGLIWIGSWNGVFRYDGLNFLKVAPYGRYLEADQKGGVWISKQGGDENQSKNPVLVERKRFSAHWVQHQYASDAHVGGFVSSRCLCPN